MLSIDSSDLFCLTVALLETLRLTSVLLLEEVLARLAGVGDIFISGTVADLTAGADSVASDSRASRADAGDRLDPGDARIVFADFFQLLFDFLQLFGQGIELCQFQIEFSFPEFFGRTFGQRFAELVDLLATAVPSRFAPFDADAVIDEPGSNGAFDFVDPVIEGLAVLHQRSKFTVCW